MKIGYVCPYSFAKPGGVQNHIFGLARWMKSQGHQVSIIGPDFPSLDIFNDYGFDGSEFVTAGPSFKVRTNGSLAHINYGRKPKNLVRRWLAWSNPDVLHIHEPLAPSVALHALCAFNGPIVGTFHAARKPSRFLRNVVRINKRIVARMSSSIAVSKVAWNVAHHLYGVKPVIIGNGIDINDYQLEPCTGKWRGGDHPRITFVGRYDEPRKGFPILQAALEPVLDRYPDLEVVVIGKGSGCDDERVTFPGFLSDADRNQLLSRSDVYVAPNTGQESFGIILIEALASGAPVVASDIPAFVDVLTADGAMVGRTFRCGDGEDLARVLLESLAEPRDLRLHDGARRAGEFDWDVLGPRIMDQYQRALGGARIEVNFSDK